MQQFLGKKLVAAVLAALLFGSSSITVWADSLDDQKADYENRAAEKQKKSNEIQRRIATISEEKRALDEQADAAINDHKEAKAALDETLARMADRFLGSDNGDGILREVGINAISETSDGDIVVGSYSGLYLYRCKERKAMPLPGSEALKDMKIAEGVGKVKDGEGDGTKVA